MSNTSPNQTNETLEEQLRNNVVGTFNADTHASKVQETDNASQEQASRLNKSNLEADLVNAQKVNQSISQSAFNVVPLDYDPEVEKQQNAEKQFQHELESYVEMCSSKNVPEDIIVAARKNASADTVKCYNDFLKLINAELDKAEKISESDDMVIRRKSVDYEIRNRLSKIHNLHEYLSALIFKTYNTSAAGVTDLLHECTSEQYAEDLCLEVYHEPIYSLILQLESAWVAELIEELVNRWEDNDAVANIVDSYIDSLGGPKTEGDYVTEYQSLLTVLPDNIKNENSPLLYKAYRAVNLIYRQRSGNEVDELEQKIIANGMAAEEFAANVELELDEGTPYEAAANVAAEETAEHFDEETRKRVFDPAKGVGIVFGSALAFKASTAKSFEEGLRNTLGEDNYASYCEHREEAKQARQQKVYERHERQYTARQERMRYINDSRAIRQAHKEAIEQAKYERELDAIRNTPIEPDGKSNVQHQQQYQQVLPQQQYNQVPPQQQYQQVPPRQGFFGRGKRANSNMYNQGYGYNQGYDPRYGNNQRYGYNQDYNNGNFAPQIPTWLMMSGINLFVGLLIWLIYGKSVALFTAVGLIIAVVGFLKQKHNEPNATITIIAGYALAVLAIFLTNMK